MNMSSRRRRRIVVRVYVANWMPTTIVAKMNDAITANEADASRMDKDMLVRNIADDDEKSIWIGKMRRPGICRGGRMSGIELLGN